LFTFFIEKRVFFELLLKNCCGFFRNTNETDALPHGFGVRELANLWISGLAVDVWHCDGCCYFEDYCLRKAAQKAAFLIKISKPHFSYKII